jgi:hypothetical protein
MFHKRHETGLVTTWSELENGLSALAKHGQMVRSLRLSTDDSEIVLCRVGIRGADQPRLRVWLPG